MVKLLFLDVETTGANIYQDYITEIAAIKLIRTPDGEIKKKAFKANVKPKPYPNVEMSDVAVEKTGITFEALEKFHSEEKVVMKFIEWLKEGKGNLSWDQRYVFIAYNAMFDWTMVKRFFQRNKLHTSFRELFLPAPFDLFTYCFMLNKKHNVTSGLKLEEMADTYSIDYDSDKTHDALEDTKILMDLFLELEKQNKLL